MWTMTPLVRYSTSWYRGHDLVLLERIGFFAFNRLTRVPTQFPQFPMLSNIDLSKNQIISIESNAFINFSSSTITSLSLSSNPITTIEQGEFQGIFYNTARFIFDFPSFILCNKHTLHLFFCLFIYLHRPVHCTVDRVTRGQMIFNPLKKKCDIANETPGCSVKPFLCPTMSPNSNYPNPNSSHSYYRCINDVPYLIVSFSDIITLSVLH